MSGEQLSAQDLRDVLNCLEALQTVCTLQDFPTRLVHLLSQMIGSDVSFCSSFTDRCNTLEIAPAELRTVHLDPSYFQQNPLIQRYFQTRDGSAYKVSDLLTKQELYRRESLYDRFFKRFGLVDQLAMVIPEQLDSKHVSPFNLMPRRFIAPGKDPSIADATTLGQLAVGFHRTLQPFDERERTLLNLIQPHIAHAYYNAQEYTKLQQQLEQLNQAMDELGSVVLSPAGRVRLISPRALQLLNQYFPGLSWLGEQLPDELQSWVKAQIQQRQQASLTQAGKPLQVEQAGQYLTIRLLGSASSGQFLLTLEENRYQSFSVGPLRRIGLTPREAEVLIWVAQGKTDAEIAAVLGIKPKTVNKHLENVYEELAVNTRAEAITEALERLGQMEQ